MYHLENPECTARPSPLYGVCDLKAQMAPLDRYGPVELGSALAKGLRALSSFWRSAVCRMDRCCEAN